MGEDKACPVLDTGVRVKDEIYQVFNMIKKKFDASIPKKMYWADEIPNSRLCPNCNAKLEKEYQSYFVEIRKESNYKSFMTGNDEGYFCPNCPIVVLDRDAFGELSSFSTEFSTPFEFAVLGIVDPNAIPEEKKNMPIGTDDNPIPLVSFTNYVNDDISTDRLKKNDHFPTQKIRRNQPCPCGSGKKYKKCCGKTA
jgi:hypothetical protein